VFGNGPYQGLEPFETSASTSRARFDYYQKYRFGEPLAQMSGPSYSWIREAIRLNHELLTKTVKNLHMPLLLFQAESDQSVSNEEQDRFLRLIRKNGGTNARKIKILGAKHEIFNAPDEVVERYWKHIFRDWNLDA
jgi:lysophospholipase